MYKFTDLVSPPVENRGVLQTIINDVNLDDNYKIKTLNVTGRGLIAPDNRLTEKVGTDGAWLEESYYPPRAILVEMLIKSDDLRTLYSRLNHDLASHNKELLEIKFTDEPEYVWYGKLNQLNQVKEDSNTQQLELEFICPDPFKYEVKTRIARAGIMNPGLLYLTRPDKMQIKMQQNAHEVKITNADNGMSIRLIEEFRVGDEVTLDFAKSTIKKFGRTNILGSLDIFSDFETFCFAAGHRIEISPASSTLEIQYRGRSL